MATYIPVRQEETHENFDIYFVAVDENKYSVQVINSPAGQSGIPVIQSLPEDTDFEERLYQIQQLMASQKDTEIVGDILGDFLFPSSIHELLQSSLALIEESEKAGLRIRLLFPETTRKLSLLPWEYSRREGSFIALNEKTPMVRYLLAAKQHNHLSIPYPTRVLLVTANPIDSVDLNIDLEIDLINKSLANLIRKGQIELEIISKTTKQKLIKSLTNFEPHILHFMGHGIIEDEAGAIILEDENRLSHLFTAQEIQKVFEKTKVRLIIFNSCQSASENIENVSNAIPYSLVWAGVPAAIGMQFDVPDKDGILFIQKIYENLAEAAPLDLAVTKARNHLYNQGTLTIFWAYPALYMRTKDASVWKKLPKPIQTPDQSPYYLKRPELYKSMKDALIKDKGQSVVGLVGFPGTGKTELAIQYAKEHEKYYSDGILWADFKKYENNLEGILNYFANAFGQNEAFNELTSMNKKALFVKQVLVRRKILIVLDNVQKGEHLKEFLFSGEENHVIITTRNQKALHSKKIKYIDITPFDASESLLYLRNRLDSDRIHAEENFALAVSEIVNNIPMALNIVAGYMDMMSDMSFAKYKERLANPSKRIERLEDWDDSEQNIANLFEISYEVLNKNAAEVFRTLAIFEGPDFNIESIIQITDLDEFDVLDALEQLRSLSLVQQGIGIRNHLYSIQETGNRYRIYSLLKDFARLKLVESQELEELQKSSVFYFSNLAKLNAYPTNHASLDLDWQNIVGAMNWAVDLQIWKPLLQGTLSLTENYLGTIGFLEIRGEWKTAIDLLSKAKEAAEELEDQLGLAVILSRLGGFNYRLGDHSEAIKNLKEALNIIQDVNPSTETIRQKAFIYQFMFELEDRDNSDKKTGWAKKAINELNQYEFEDYSYEKGLFLILFAIENYHVGNFKASLENVQAGLSLLARAPASSTEVSGLIVLSSIYDEFGELEKRKENQDKALAMADDIGDLRRKAIILNDIGIDFGNKGKLNKAKEHLLNALEIFEYMGDFESQADANTNLGMFETILGNYDQARAFLEKAYGLAVDFQFSTSQAFASAYTAYFYLHQGLVEKALPYLDEAYSVCLQGNLYFTPTVLCLKADLERLSGNIDAGLNYAFNVINDELASEFFQLELGIAWSIIGKIYDEQKQFNEAIKAYQKSIVILGNTGQYLYEYTQSKVALAHHYTLVNSKSNKEQAKGILEDALESYYAIGAIPDFNQAKAALSLLNDQNLP